MTLHYLATVYTKHPKGIEKAFEEAAGLVARLLRRGIISYSAIAHTHPVAIHGNIDPLDHSIWLDFDQAMMDRCDVLLVANMPGWQESKGIAFETNWVA